MRILWNESFPGIFMRPKTFNPNTMRVSELGSGEGAAFVSAGRWSGSCRNRSVKIFCR